MSNEPTKDAGGKATPGDELHPPPSMLWVLIPLALIAAYALLTK